MIKYFNPSPSRPSLVLFAPVDASYIRRERRKERRGVMAPEDTDNEAED